MSNKEHPGDRIRLLRKAMDHQQTTFAESLTISNSLLSLIESNKRPPSTMVLEYLQIVYQINPEWIMTGDGHPFESHWKMKDPEKIIRRLDRLRRIEGYTQGVTESPAPYIRSIDIPIIARASLNPGGRHKWTPIRGEHLTISDDLVAIGMTDDPAVVMMLRAGRILCDPDADVKSGDVAVVKIHHRGVFFKRVFRQKGRDEYILQPILETSGIEPMVVSEKQVDFLYKIIAILIGGGKEK